MRNNTNDVQADERDGRFRYKCGLATDDKITLKKRLEVRQSDTGELVEVHQPSDVWTVLGPSRNVVTGDADNSVVWLLRPDGRRHTWEDDASIFEFFEAETPAMPIEKE